MALDTILNAIERQSMEKEHARLESRLQHARRMETVGTFTSGVAHNFNNILGGILGHTEIMEEYLAPDARPQRNLDAIRRGAGARPRRSNTQLRAPPGGQARARLHQDADRGSKVPALANVAR
jgi:signal transduction histidine kinase